MAGLVLAIVVGILIGVKLIAPKPEAGKPLNPPALQVDPEFTKTEIQIGYNSSRRGDYAGAITAYRLALQADPNLPDALNNLAWLFTTCPEASLRNGPEAVRLAEKACELTHHRMTGLVGTLAAAYAEAGRFDDAMATAQQACALASKAGEPDLLKKNQELLVLYRAHQPYHEAAEKLVPAAR